MMHKAYALSMAVALTASMAAHLQAAEPAVPESPYMGEPVELATAPRTARSPTNVSSMASAGWDGPNPLLSDR